MTEVCPIDRVISAYFHTMKVIRSNEFTAERAWGALSVAEMNGITVRIHWTDQPYKWHINDGSEVFTVLDGTVDMYYKEIAQEKKVELKQGDTFYAESGDEHYAHPQGPARILVIEKKGSV